MAWEQLFPFSPQDRCNNYLLQAHPHRPCVFLVHSFVSSNHLRPWLQRDERVVSFSQTLGSQGPFFKLPGPNRHWLVLHFCLVSWCCAPGQSWGQWFSSSVHRLACVSIVLPETWVCWTLLRACGLHVVLYYNKYDFPCLEVSSWNCQSPGLVCLGMWPVIAMLESFRSSPYSALVASSNLGKLQGLSYSSRQTSGGAGASSPACDSTTLSSRESWEGTGLSAWDCGVRVWGCFFSQQWTKPFWLEVGAWREGHGSRRRVVSGMLTPQSCRQGHDLGLFSFCACTSYSLFVKWSQKHPLFPRKATVISYEVDTRLLAYRRAFRLLFS